MIAVARVKTKRKPAPKPYRRGREFLTISESWNLRNPDGTNGPRVNQFIDSHYITMVAAIRLHDPFQDADNRRNPLVFT